MIIKKLSDRTLCSGWRFSYFVFVSRGDWPFIASLKELRSYRGLKYFAHVQIKIKIGEI